MALPLTYVRLGSDFAALPIVVGGGLEILRSVVRRPLKRQVRERFIDQAARQALDKRVLVPAADVEATFWAAYWLERAMTTDLPAFVASSLAGASILVLAVPVAGARVVTELSASALLLAFLAVWTNRWRQPAINALVEHRQRVATWVAIAERDSGEIYGSRARAPFLAVLRDNVQRWSSAEERLEIGRLNQRLFIGAVFTISVMLLLGSQHVDPFHLQFPAGKGGSSLLLLSTGIPACYVFVEHADGLLVAHGSLTQLLSRSPLNAIPSQRLSKRSEALVARGVCFSYPGSASRAGLRPLDFNVDLRRLTLIVAPNGTGKTTLARLICGVLTADAGTLQIDGVACNDVSRDDFGFVPQNPLIIENLTIEENVRLVSPDSSAAAIETVLLELGLQRPLNLIAGVLSRGEQRRVAIARAILKEPRLLLLDEPDVWLDSEGRAALARVLDRQLSERAVIVVSHRNDWLPDGGELINLEPQGPPEIGIGSNSA
ncbi:MAG: ABC transporter ATP-binding protein [Myxococcales bacterium]